MILAFAILASLLPAQVAQAAPFDPNDMVFPVGGDQYRLTDSFGDCRDGCARSHEGVDIMAPKGTPVYAVADGIATWVSQNQSECCRLQIDHGDGWATRYIHLNDDRQDANGNYLDYDDQGWGIAEGITNGTAIKAGQLIGWVGDSGNAAETVTHLHFELRRYEGSIWNSTAIDPYPYLIIAEMDYQGQFYDDDGSKHQADIEKIYAAGITKGCNPPANNQFCPSRYVSRGEMAAFIRRTLGLPDVNIDYYVDDNGGTFEADANALTAAGIAFGCNAAGDRFCSGQPLLREEFAEMFTRAFGYTNPGGTDWFVDDDDSVFEASIDALKAAGVTKGCNPPDNTKFCPYRGVEREEMASFFVRALGL